MPQTLTTFTRNTSPSVLSTVLRIVTDHMVTGHRWLHTPRIQVDQLIYCCCLLLRLS